MLTVVITGADHPTGLGIARALRFSDCNIIGLCKDKESFCCYSKYWQRLIPYKSSSCMFEVLVSLGKEHQGKMLLYPCQDDAVRVISENRSKLKKYYYFSLPGEIIVDILLDKTKFHTWAEKNGFNVPSSVICHSPEELEKSFDQIGFPLIIKPYEKTEEWGHASPIDKILKFQSKDDYYDLSFDIFKAASKILVQQWIPGGDSNVFFCLVYYDAYGTQKARFTGRKLLQAPPYCGSTAAAIGVKNPEVDEITSRLFSLVDYRGLGSLELKRSDNDGKYYLVEPTVGRNDLQSNLALSGGVNLTQLALADILDVQLPEFKYRRAAWIDEMSFIESMRYYIKIRKVNVFELLSLVNFNIYFSLFNLHDIKPFQKWVGKRIIRFFS